MQLTLWMRIHLSTLIYMKIQNKSIKLTFWLWDILKCSPHVTHIDRATVRCREEKLHKSQNKRKMAPHLPHRWDFSCVVYIFAYVNVDVLPSISSTYYALLALYDIQKRTDNFWKFKNTNGKRLQEKCHTKNFYTFTVWISNEHFDKIDSSPWLL